MATITVSVRRDNGVNIQATSADIDDNAVIDLAMMLGALVFDSVSNPLAEPEDAVEVPVSVPAGTIPIPVPDDSES